MDTSDDYHKFDDEKIERYYGNLKPFCFCKGEPIFTIGPGYC